MTTLDLTRKVFLRIGKFKLLILAIGLGLGALGYLYARTISPIYTARLSVFPLTAGSENNNASSLLSTLTGINDNQKSFSQEASINIVELATSRTTREAVAMEKLPKFNNKSIAQVLIENDPRFDYKNLNDTLIRSIGGDIIKNGMVAKFNKNGILEITFSSTNSDIISPISYVLIDKISQFYKDLKVKKAQFDYDFTVRKMDSLQIVLDEYDQKAIKMSNTTLFTPEERIEYIIPKENLINDKSRVVRQRDGAAGNKEEALWRLQKVTPIIEILDKPDPPFAETRPSKMVYAFIGLILGCFLGVMIFIADILYKYVNSEINNAVFGNEDAVVVEDKSSTTTTTSSTL